MRILITRNGTQIFTDDEIEEERIKSKKSVEKDNLRRKIAIDKYIFNKRASSLNKTTYNKNFTGLNINNDVQSTNGENDHKFYKTSNTFFENQNFRKIFSVNKIKEIMNDNSIKLKNLKLKGKLYNFPNGMQEKYENCEEKVMYHTSLNNRLSSYLETESESQRNKKPTFFPIVEKQPVKEIKTKDIYSLAEILGNKKVNNLLNSTFQKEKMRNKLSVIDEQNFRTDYSKLSEVCNLRGILEYKKISKKNAELIKYLKTRKEITPLFLKNIAYSQPYKLYKADKLSINMLNRDDMEKTMKSQIKIKLKYQNNVDKIEGSLFLKDMSQKLNQQDEIIEKYNTNYDKKLIYKEKHKEFIKDYWKKRYIRTKVVNKDKKKVNKIKNKSKCSESSVE